MKAVWNSATVAASDDIAMVEGNAYFPESAVDRSCLKPSATRTTCPWKGVAHYYTLVVAGKEHPNAGWYYPEPKPAAASIKGRVAFGKGVAVA
jgi:uncharacterized protein (DUF427 family)